MAQQKKNNLVVLAVAAALAVLAPLAHGQGGAITGQVIQTNGYPAANAPVRVCPYTSTGDPCAPLANIYQDPYLGTAIGNPTATDANGNYSVFAAAGYYIVQITPNAGVTYNYLVSSNGSASVYSVGLSMPGIFTVANSPITSGGVLGVTLNAQAPNLVFASPTPGSGVPGFHTLTTAYLPFTYTGNTLELPTASGAFTAGHGVKIDSNGNLIDTATAAATVSSVGISTAANFLTIGSSPVTGAGTITLSFGATGTGTDVVTATAPGTSGYAATWTGSGDLGATQLYYQTAKANGTARTQRPALNFSSAFTLTDSASPAQTTVGVNGSGNGSYIATVSSLPSTSTSFAQWDGSGNLTTAASTACGSYSSTEDAGCTVLADGKWLEWVEGATVNLASCSVGSPGASPSPYGGLCSEPYITLTWPVAFITGCLAPYVSDNNATVDPTNGGSGQTYASGSWMVIGTPSTTQIEVQRVMYRADSGVAGLITSYNGYPTAYCIGN